MSDENFPIEFTLTPSQKEALKNAANSRKSRPGEKEDAVVSIDGHITEKGELFIKNLSVEFIHRWMDCMRP